jgi:hypothetical protein
MDCVTEVVRGTTPPPRNVVWALVSPVEFYWQRLAGKERGFVRFVEGWIGKVPLPAALELGIEQEMRDELDLLSRTIFRASSVRHMIGQRLVDCYWRPGSASASLREVLSDTGYLP